MKRNRSVPALALACLLDSGCGGPGPAVADRPSAEQTTRAEAEAKARDIADREEQDRARKLARDGAMARGVKAREANDLRSAVAAFREALDRVPGDQEAFVALAGAEFADFREQGKAALEGGRPGDAIQALGQAIGRNPGDQGCLDLRARAIALLRPQLMDQGREAMKAGRYPEAAKRFGEAKGLGADPEVAALLAEANFRAKLEAGRRSLDGKQFAAALPDLDAAFVLKPDDLEARDLYRQAREGKARQEKEDYESALQVGDAAMDRKDYLGAVSSYLMAMAKPGHDARVAQKLAQAQAEQRKKDSFERHMRQGKQMLALNPTAAQAEFQAALVDSPGHPEATRLLNEARRPPAAGKPGRR